MKLFTCVCGFRNLIFIKVYALYILYCQNFYPENILGYTVNLLYMLGCYRLGSVQFIFQIAFVFFKSTQRNSQDVRFRIFVLLKVILLIIRKIRITYISSHQIAVHVRFYITSLFVLLFQMHQKQFLLFLKYVRIAKLTFQLNMVYLTFPLFSWHELSLFENFLLFSCSIFLLISSFLSVIKFIILIYTFILYIK